MTSLYETQSRIDAYGNGYIACIDPGCTGVAEGRMLCAKHERSARRDGTLWQYPGNYLDDYSGEGQDTLNEIISWLFEWNAHEMFMMMDELNVKFELVGSKTSRLGFGGYKWALGEDGCFECGKSEVKSRGLCEKHYYEIRDNPRGLSLSRYPNRRYVSNVKGHAHFVLRYHLSRVAELGSFYGLKITV